MKHTRFRPSRVIALLTLAALALPGLAAEKVLLQLKAKPGNSTRTEMNLALEINAGGQKVNVAIKSTEKIEYKSVAPNGDITMERRVESMEQSVNGEEMETDPSELKGVSTIVAKNSGQVISRKSDQDDAEGMKLDARIANGLQFVFSDKPVGVGDKWSFNYAADEAAGTKRGGSTYTLVGFEKVDGIDTAKIQMNFSEADGSPKFSTEATVWVEVASGEAVKIQAKLNNLPFGEGGMELSVSGTAEGKRVAGGAMAGDAGKAEPPKAKTIDDEMKDWEKIPGQFPLYRKREAGRLQLRMEMPEAILGQWVMLQATASTGNNSQFVAGNPISDLLFQFKELEPDKITLVVPNYWMRADANTPIQRAVQRSFAESFLETFKVEARQPDRKTILIDVSDLFRGNIGGVFDAMSGGGGMAALFGGGGGYAPDREKTFISEIKNFPENLVVETTYSFNRSGPGGISDLMNAGNVADGRNVVIRVNYNLYALPKNSYRPRFSDPRVGYFTTDYTDFSNPTDLDLMRKVILRWDLQKKDPKAEVSEPVKPITFWLDNAIPVEYRDTMKDALLSWNKAFEGAGIKNAVVVKQMPDKADFDHADMRFNVVRWVTSGNNAYAIALFRTNPITGEILNASITVDAGIVQFFAAEADKVVRPAGAAKTQQHIHGDACCMPNEVRTQAALGLLAGRMAITLQGLPFDEKAYVKQFVHWVTAHEFGHILGLRHNFIASTGLDVEELGDPAKVAAVGTSSSVMDYVPFNVSAIGKKDVPFWTGIGAYDKWAIQFGYKDFGGFSSSGEVAALRRHASMNNQPGLAYQSDETADQWDPQVQRFDLSKRPMEYWAKMMELSGRLLMNLDRRQPQNGQSFYEFTRDFYLLLGMHQRAASTAAMSIGGLNLNGNWKGDPGEQAPLRPVPAAEQRKAMELLNRYVFGAGAIEIPKRMLVNFASNPNAGMLESLFGGSSDNPVFDSLTGFQTGLLSSLFSSEVLGRVVNNEFKADRPANAFRLVDMFNGVSEAVWAELKSGAAISATRRELQRAYITQMGDMITKPGDSRPNDAKMLAWAWLKELQKRLQAAKPSASDPYTPIHIQECLMRVERILDAELTIGQPSSGGGGSLLDQLLGGAKPPVKSGG